MGTGHESIQDFRESAWSDKGCQIRVVMAWMFVYYDMGLGEEAMGGCGCSFWIRYPCVDLTGMAAEQKAFGFVPLLNGAYVIGVLILVGSLGNTWRENNLVKREYEYKETVQAQNPEAALAL